ncbi:hypothetical protein ACFLQL_00210 [Verrucomicrobiota bacterium]
MSSKGKDKRVITELNQEGKLSSFQPWAPSEANRYGVDYKDKIFVGTVISCCVGTYEFIVQSDNKDDMRCCTLNKTLGYANSIGTSESVLYPEGTSVLVCAVKKSYGIILGALPLIESEYTSNLPPAGNISYEGAFSVNTDPLYLTTAYNDLNMIQPIDLAPGNISYTNEAGLAFAILNLLMVLKASERAKIELFSIDDFIRVTSGQYQHNSAASILLNLNDDGCNTAELSGSNHQCEMNGIGAYIPIFEADEYKAKEAKNTATKCIVEDPYIRPRYMQMLGHLGGIYDFFVLNPYDSSADKDHEVVEQYSTSKKYQGLFHGAIDGSGRLLVRSAAGICLQRCDKIPVPKKLKEAWDPSGDKGSGITAKLPFIWDTTHPYAKHLQLRDAFAYYTRNAYQRFLDKNRDWFLPNELDLTTPENDYEKTGKLVNGKIVEVVHGEEDFDNAPDSRSYITMDKDGSITLRDGFGSEICMKGGNITIACPGNLELRPGKSIVALGGHDVIIKGKESVDISATNKDVRIKAEKNMELYSNAGGILIESAAAERHDWQGNIGEDVISSGIYLKAAKARIFAWANVVHLSSITLTILESFKQARSTLMLAFNNILGTAKQMLFTTKRSSLILNTTTGMLTGPTAYLAGKEGAAMFKDSKILLAQEAKIKSNPYEMLNKETSKHYIDYWDDAEAEPLSILFTDDLKVAERENIKFTFRTANQYGTFKASETYKGGDAFVVYETSWSYLAQIKDKFLADIQPDVWVEKEVNETYPWPGKENYKEDCLVSLVEEINMEKDGIKQFGKIENDASDKLEKQSLDNLIVVRHEEGSDADITTTDSDKQGVEVDKKYWAILKE